MYDKPLSVIEVRLDPRIFREQENYDGGSVFQLTNKIKDLGMAGNDKGHQTGNHLCIGEQVIIQEIIHLVHDQFGIGTLHQLLGLGVFHLCLGLCKE